MSADVITPIEDKENLTVLNVTFMWTIQNFSKCNCLMEIESPTFLTESDISYKLQLYLYPATVQDNTDSSLEIDFNCTTEPKYPLEFVFGIINNKDEIIKPSRYIIEKRKELITSLDNFINIDFAKNPLNGLITNNDEFRVLCQIKTINKDAHAPFIQSAYQSQISKDIESFFGNERFSDVILIDETGQQIHAHRLLLAARSPVFASMFTHDMKEQKEKTVTIPNIRFECLREMLRFIYTGKVKNLEEIAVDLLAAANQYALDELKETCEHFLAVNLKVDDAISILVVADKYSASVLKDKALKFIVNNIKDITNTEAFESLEGSHVNLAKEIIISMAEKSQ